MHPTPDSPAVTIGPTAEKDWAAALWLLFQDEAQPGRRQLLQSTLAAARRGETSFEYLLNARRGDQLVGASWGQVMPGHAATVWPPRLAQDETKVTADQMFTMLQGNLQSQGVQLAQALTHDATTPDAQFLGKRGFSHAADLLYMVSTSDSHAIRSSESPAGPVLQFEPYSQAQRAQLARLIDATYVETQDIPALNGVRATEDVIEGYLHAGAHDPARWFVVRHGPNDVGCLLLADYPQHDQWELVYMGLVPEARGQGLGGQLTRHAQRLTCAAGRSRLVLAVDCKNSPAIETYLHAGFEQWDRRSVFITTFDSARF